MVMDFVKELAGSSMRGLIANNIPSVAKGMINEIFARYHITPETVIPMVENKESLWKKINPQDYFKIQKALDQVENLDWFTADWLLNAIKEKHPALVSLFVTWKKGQNWLIKQIEEIKTQTENLREHGGE
ncbi:MAG TPA: hypothetical protein ENI27_07975 [bacterium]|nr:hypothetical protein [bacterium]